MLTDCAWSSDEAEKAEDAAENGAASAEHLECKKPGSDAFQGYQVSIYTFDDPTAAHEYALDQFFGVFYNDTIVVHGGDEFKQALILACGCGEIVATPA